MKRRTNSGFTTIELVLILVVIGILLALVASTRSGVQQSQRNTERQRDIKELRDGLEGYFANNNHYPTIQELNSSAWRSTHLKAIEPQVFRDPKGTDDLFTDRAKAGSYTYSVTSASGTPCDNVKNVCTQYTLTATLEGGGTYTKNNLN